METPPENFIKLGDGFKLINRTLAGLYVENAAGEQKAFMTADVRCDNQIGTREFWVRPRTYWKNKDFFRA